MRKCGEVRDLFSPTEPISTRAITSRSTYIFYPYLFLLVYGILSRSKLKLIYIVLECNSCQVPHPPTQRGGLKV